MAELRKVIDLNGEPVVELMKRGKNSQFTGSEGGGRGEMIKDLLAVFSHLYPPMFDLKRSVQII